MLMPGNLEICQSHKYIPVLFLFFFPMSASRLSEYFKLKWTYM